MKSTKHQKTTNRNWHLVDVSNQVLGRAATQIAKILQGKHKTNYSPNLDSGDYVVVINASKVQVTGRKNQSKVYTRYSGYPGGLRRETFADLMVRRPEEVVRHAVSGMLPKNKLRDKRLGRLHIFKTEDHKYSDKFQTKS